MTDLESRVAALEQDMAEVKGELHCIRSRPKEESVEAIATDLLLSAVKEAQYKANLNK